jgi:alpha-D-ribose 1-methylphosphonate 5-triphosphate diphosphatase
VFSMLGARVAMFPASRRVAASARAMGDPVVLAAGDVAAERVTAVDLVREGLCSALASARSAGTMTAAVWRLVDRGVCDLARGWTLVSERPAEIARLPDRGRIEPGLRADLVVIRAETRAVEATVSAGRLVHAAGEAGERLLVAARHRALAAE